MPPTHMKSTKVQNSLGILSMTPHCADIGQPFWYTLWTVCDYTGLLNRLMQS